MHWMDMDSVASPELRIERMFRFWSYEVEFRNLFIFLFDFSVFTKMLQLFELIIEIIHENIFVILILSESITIWEYFI